MSTVDQETTRVSFRPGELEITPDGAGHLMGSRCGSCGTHYFPGRRMCARCLSDAMDRVPLSVTGTLYTYTVVRQSTPAFEVPYVLGYVDLPEGVRVMAQIAGCEPEEVQIGMPVVLSLEPFGDDEDGRQVIAYRFRPAEIEDRDV